MKSNNFKIIAIRALSGCNNEYTKVLELNKLYYFYSDYLITNKNGIETISNKSLDNYPEKIFNIKGVNNEIVINISAIVGKNGSGKSSVIDLLFRAINNVAYNFKSQKLNTNKTITADLKIVEKLQVEFYYQTDKFYKVVVKNEKIEVFTFNEWGEINLNSIDKTFNLSHLFYTEAVNYSHYAYNSLDFGYYKNEKFVDWLKELFHKNDSYQTPLVLNPMRTEGNFNINIENDLVRQRLLANLLRPVQKGNLDFRKIGDNLEAHKLILKLRDTKTEVSYWEKGEKNNFIEKFYNLSVFKVPERNDIVKILMFELVNLPNFNIDLLNEKKYAVARSYIIYKLISICKKYEDYYNFLLPKHLKFNQLIFQQFIKKLKDDTSHITFKLKQTLNYLKNDYIRFSNDKIELTIEEVSKSIQKTKPQNQSILEFIPPPIFEIEIVLKQIKSGTELIKFSSLSSGEKQQIYMVSSLLYHLYNLDSVTGYKVKYHNINIILEEIELYFHPEMQRTFIKYFLDSIGRLELANIRSINICFITHSPFILSDIPSSNIMFLKVENGKAIQEQRKKNTFGANIHSLLMDNFFFNSNTYIGEFAHFKINETIQWLNEINNEKANKRNFELLLKEKKYYKNLIEIIDERIIKTKLLEMYFEVFGNEESEKDIEFEIQRLQDKLKSLKKK
ncbi:hypothetical protein [Flavobacterium frigidarium]|uniref:AAA family ATPase n=1 Tax=Flavobacterium frigidarium TaxID=99286 RepID=A0ABV4KEJ6_9FLAO